MARSPNHHTVAVEAEKNVLKIIGRNGFGAPLNGKAGPSGSWHAAPIYMNKRFINICKAGWTSRAAIPCCALRTL